nr:hypothetical protein CFP56_50825 [Quercus suber]
MENTIFGTEEYNDCLLPMATNEGFDVTGEHSSPNPAPGKIHGPTVSCDAILDVHRTSAATRLPLSFHARGSTGHSNAFRKYLRDGLNYRPSPTLSTVPDVLAALPVTSVEITATPSRQALLPSVPSRRQGQTARRKQVGLRRIALWKSSHRTVIAADQNVHDQRGSPVRAQFTSSSTTRPVYSSAVMLNRLHGFRWCHNTYARNGLEYGSWARKLTICWLGTGDLHFKDPPSRLQIPDISVLVQQRQQRAKSFRQPSPRPACRNHGTTAR